MTERDPEDTRLVAWRLLGKVQRWVPAWIVLSVHHAFCCVLDTSLPDRKQVPEFEPDRAEMVAVLSECINVMLDKEKTPDEALLKCKQMLTPHFRGIGK